jgi:hypothetical protein
MPVEGGAGGLEVPACVPNRFSVNLNLSRNFASSSMLNVDETGQVARDDLWNERHLQVQICGGQTRNQNS